MKDFWQNAIVLAMLLAAAAYIGHRAWRILRKKAAGCGGGCSKCAQGPAQQKAQPLSATPTNFVPLDTLRSSARQQR